jgi:hypothetical protein
MRNQGDQQERNVIAGRRRRPDAGLRDRAETPDRQGYSGGGDIGRGGSGGFGGGGLGGFPSSGGRGQSAIPGGKGGCLSGVGGFIVLIIIVIFYMLQGGDFSLPFADTGMESAGDYSASSSGTGQIAGLPGASPFVSNYQSLPATASKSGQSWLIMLYQDADDSILERDMCMDLNEAEKAGTADKVKIVAQMDRYNGGYRGDGNWTGTKRFLITQDDNLNTLRSKELADIGEANMADSRTLVDFVTWAMQTYPSNKCVLILSDHGMGWPGGWSDATARGSGDQNIPLQSQAGDKLYLNELDSALSQIRSKTGLDKFELIGMDACLMAQLEVFTMLEPHARYAVASEETEPSVGWAYTDIFKNLNQNPDMDGGQLGKLIVESYIEDDQRIVDRSARAELLSQDSPLGGLYGASDAAAAQQLAREIGQSSTLSAVDLSKLKSLNAGLNQLVYSFQKANQKAIASSRSYAQSYTSVFGSQIPPSYIDLGNFLQIVKQKSGSNDINQSVDNVIAGIRQAVIAEKHGVKEPGSTGISIYFPNSQLYKNFLGGAKSYTATANRFASESLWDDFLAFFYTGQQFSLGTNQAAVPTRTITAPAAGGIKVSAVTASAQSVNIRQKVTLKANISGENIGYIYLFAGFYDQKSNSVFIADRDYLESDKTREANGIYYPDWGQGSFTLQFDWEPVVFAIDDGKTRVTALFKPESYGRSYEEAVYTVDGTYTFADSGEQLPARLYFINGVMRKVVGFNGTSQAGTPHEITPAAGDTFIVLDTWLDLDGGGNVVSTVTQSGKKLTFGNTMFTWKTLDAAAGEYRVGFDVEDLDGNRQQVLVKVTVK